MESVSILNLFIYENSYIFSIFLGYALFFSIPEYKLSSSIAKSLSLRLLLIPIPDVDKKY